MPTQELPTKECACGRGRIYTSERGKIRNAQINGKAVCQECVLDNIYSRFNKKEDSDA